MGSGLTIGEAMSLDHELERAPVEVGERAGALDLSAIVAQLRSARQQWRALQGRPLELSGRELPSREALVAILADLRGALFPMRLGPPSLRQESEDFYVGHTLDSALHALIGQVRLELGALLRHHPAEAPVLHLPGSAEACGHSHQDQKHQAGQLLHGRHASTRNAV